MARPESVEDIDLEPVEFATVILSAIATDGTYIKAYGAFMEACQKAGAVVKVNYNTTASLTRPPDARESEDQLRSKQATWDHAKKLYEQLRDIGTLEHSYMESTVRQWAENENLPYPPEHEPITAVDLTRDIEWEPTP